MRSCDLQSEMEPERVVEQDHKIERYETDSPAHTVDCDRSDLLGLRFGVMPESRVGHSQEYLERVDLSGVAGQRDDGDDPASEPGCGHVGAVVADDHHRSRTGCFRAGGRAKIGDAALVASRAPADGQPGYRARATRVSGRIGTAVTRPG